MIGMSVCESEGKPPTLYWDVIDMSGKELQNEDTIEQ